jgi:hypothetical protein
MSKSLDKSYQKVCEDLENIKLSENEQNRADEYLSFEFSASKKIAELTREIAELERGKQDQLSVLNANETYYVNTKVLKAQIEKSIEIDKRLD